MILTRFLVATLLSGDPPELRFGHSWDASGYDNGPARNQFFFGMDVIDKF